MSQTPPSAGRTVYKVDRKYLLSAAAGVWICMAAGDAFGQAPPAAEAPPPAVEAIPTPAAGTAALEQRLDDLDQRIRISDRKLELAQEAAAAERKAAPVTTIDEKGLNVKSGGDGNFRVGVHGLLQVDGRRAIDNLALSDRDTWVVRRARPILEASWLGIADARLMPDFGNGTTALLDAYIDVGRPWLKLRAGKFKPPVGLERLQSDGDLVFTERALDANLSAQRDVGAELRGDAIGGLLRYSLGMFNGAADNGSPDVDFDHAKTYAGRLFVQPFALPSLKPFGKLGVGFGFTTGIERGSPAISNGTVPNTFLSPFRTADQANFFTYLTSTTDVTATVFAIRRHTRLNPQLYYYFGPFGLMAEYIHEYQEVAKGGTTAAVNNASAHGTASYVYGGDVAFDGVTPKHPFDLAAGHIGAVEVGLRYEWLKVDDIVFPVLADPNRSARKAESVAAALTWYFSRNLRANFNYAHTWFEGGAPMGGNRQTEKVILGRLQASF